MRLAKKQSPIVQVAKRYHLDLVVLFGSYAKGYARADSDLDVAVRAFKPGWIGARRVPEWKWRLEVIGAVAGALASVRRPPGISLGKIKEGERLRVDGRAEVDVSFLNRATPLFLFEVARHGKPLYQRKPTDFITFQSYAARLYYDNEKFFRLTRQYLEKRFGEKPRPKTRRAKTVKSGPISR